ncbi:MAG: ankyrin repeat domain-containing protein [Candidatus Obscuribacterales bacterium]
MQKIDYNSMPPLQPLPDPLVEAARRGDVNWIQEAYQQGANLNDPDPWGDTPIAVASRAGHYETVEYLVNCGCNPFLPNGLKASELARDFPMIENFLRDYEELLIQ